MRSTSDLFGFVCLWLILGLGFSLALCALAKKKLFSL